MISQLGLIADNFLIFMKKNHGIIFFSIVALFQGIAIFSLYQVLSITLDAPVDTNSTIQPFDQKTVDKIKRLHDSSDAGSETITLPSPRLSPFGE